MAIEILVVAKVGEVEIRIAETGRGERIFALPTKDAVALGAKLLEGSSVAYALAGNVTDPVESSELHITPPTQIDVLSRPDESQKLLAVAFGGSRLGFSLSRTQCKDLAHAMLASLAQKGPAN